MMVKYKGRVLRSVLWGLVYAFLAVNIFLFNVVLHEIGHYVAADYYNLEPEIELEFGNMTNLSFGFELEGQAVASTSFINNGNENNLFVITAMGPFMNLFLGVIFLFGFLFVKKNWFRELCVVGIVISFMSFVMNLIPVGGSDGSFIFGFV